MNAHRLPADLDDALFSALQNTVGCELAFAATEAVSEILAARRDAVTDMIAPLPETKPLNWLLGYSL